MKMIRFTVSDTVWAVPIEYVVGVRSAEEMRMLPDPEPGVAGVIDHDGHTYVVVESLGTGGRHVLLARVGGKPLGLLVDEAVGIAEIDPAALRPRPPGQRRDLIEATHGVAADLTFVLDPRELVAEFDTPKEMVR